jgi:DNA damage-binding protein 1
MYPVLAQLVFDDKGDITAIESFIFNGDQGQVSLFCVGTSSYDETKPDEATGSIHFVTVQPAGDGFALSTVYTQKVPGTIYGIVNSNGYVVLAVGSAVRTFVTDTKSSANLIIQVYMYKIAFVNGAFTLTEETKWNHSYIINNLVAKDDMLFLGDQISSVTVLKNDNGKFVNVAKDFSPLWPVAIQATAEGGIIGADVGLLIHILRISATNLFYTLVQHQSVHLQFTNKCQWKDGIRERRELSPERFRQQDHPRYFDFKYLLYNNRFIHLIT